jgi:GH15 family glucan-1,4-alpha-glucosidase
VDRYPNIADHGLIGDLQTAALVTTDGVLDWFCCPRFDSPSVFASVLDADKGLISAAINLDKMIDNGPGAVVPGAVAAAV